MSLTSVTDLIATGGEENLGGDCDGRMCKEIER